MENIFDIAIIGGGTAGMSAAIYGSRAGRKVILIEKSVYGGQIISSSEVENYPAFSPSTGYDFAIELHQQVCSLDIKQVTDEVTSISCDDYITVKCTLHSYQTRTLIISTGTVSRTLSLPGEEKFLGRGLSYCAVCDGAFHKGKVTAVVGGGNTAIEEALYLAMLCKRVYLIQRGDSLTGEDSLISQISSRENIEVLLNTTVTQLKGDDVLGSIKISSGSKTSELNISGLFVAVGRVPQNNIFEGSVELDDDGYIIAEEDCRTSRAGIFAAGDCRTKELRQLVTAAADGARAATEAVRYLKAIH